MDCGDDSEEETNGHCFIYYYDDEKIRVCHSKEKNYCHISSDSNYPFWIYD